MSDDEFYMRRIAVALESIAKTLEKMERDNSGGL